MSTNSNIEWTDVTWNPVTGCTRASAGCDHCYAVTMTHRLERMGQTKKYGGLTVLNPNGDRHFNGVVRTHDDVLLAPLKWKKPKRVFVNSMSDLFHKDVPFEFVDKVFAVMALCPQHTFQVLTKRPERMAEYTYRYANPSRWLTTAYHLGLPGSGRSMSDGDWPNRTPPANPLPNVWLGTSVENQKAADERIPFLLQVPAAVRFLSMEPMLGPVELSDVTRRSDAVERLGKNALDGIHWVIVGGESGPGARPCNVEWIRSIVYQCYAVRTPCFLKQLGAGPFAGQDETEHAWPEHVRFVGRGDGYADVKLKDRKGGDMDEWPDDLRVREFPEVARV